MALKEKYLSLHFYFRGRNTKFNDCYIPVNMKLVKNKKVLIIIIV